MQRQLQKGLHSKRSHRFAIALVRKNICVHLLRSPGRFFLQCSWTCTAVTSMVFHAVAAISFDCCKQVFVSLSFDTSKTMHARKCTRHFQRREKKKKEKFMPFSNHNGALLRQQSRGHFTCASPLKHCFSSSQSTSRASCSTKWGRRSRSGQWPSMSWGRAAKCPSASTWMPKHSCSSTALSCRSCWMSGATSSLLPSMSCMTHNVSVGMCVNV